MGAAPEVLQALRARIRALESSSGAGAPVQRRRVPSGVPAIDDLLGGLPVPGIVELSGPEGSGRARIALAIAAAAARRRPAGAGGVAWVDPIRRLYPPAVADHGVPLERLLVVRPPDDGAGAWAWATEQLLRSGSFPLVVVDHPGAQRAPQRALAHGWARAAEQGGSLCLVITARPVRALPAEVRIGVGSGTIVVLRDRAGIAGGLSPIPAPPPGAAPW